MPDTFSGVLSSVIVGGPCHSLVSIVSVGLLLVLLVAHAYAGCHICLAESCYRPCFFQMAFILVCMFSMFPLSSITA